MEIKSTKDIKKMELFDTIVIPENQKRIAESLFVYHRKKGKDFLGLIFYPNIENSERFYRIQRFR